MNQILEAHRYNNDLLKCGRDQNTASKAYPDIFHALYDPKLIAAFDVYNEPANSAKTQSRRWGRAAVLLAVVALCGASAERYYQSAPGWAVVFAISGLVAIAVGLSQVLIGTSKRKWLCNRMLGERLRQFHFQLFVCRVYEIIKSLENKNEEQGFIAERTRWLSEFALRFQTSGAVDAEFDALLQYEGDSLWLHQAPSVAANVDAIKSLSPRVIAQFFDAYRDLRIQHQFHYAGHKLARGQGIFALLSLQSQRTILEGISIGAVILLFVIEFLVTLQILDGITHMLVIWCAVFALAARTLEDGMQPRRELERYRRYGVDTQDILKRFNATHSNAEKFKLMVEMERVAYEEMRDFFRSAAAARFVM